MSALADELLADLDDLDGGDENEKNNDYQNGSSKRIQNDEDGSDAEMADGNEEGGGLVLEGKCILVI